MNAFHKMTVRVDKIRITIAIPSLGIRHSLRFVDLNAAINDPVSRKL